VSIGQRASDATVGPPDAGAPPAPSSAPRSRFSLVPGKLWLWIVLLGILWVFFAPIVRLVILSFSTETFPVLDNYAEVFAEARTWRVVRNTLFVSIVGTAISVVIGVGLAWLAAYTDIRGKVLFHALVLLPFVLPGYLYTIAWVQFLAPSSLFTQVLTALPGIDGPFELYNLRGIAFILGLRHMPLVYLLTLGVLRRIPRPLEHAARISGAGPFETFRKVTLPMAAPGIAAGGLLAFLSNLDNFGIPAVLGIPAGISVLSTAIYQEVVSFGPAAFARAAVLAVILGVVALLGTGVQQLVIRRSRSAETRTEDKDPRLHLRGIRPVIEVALFGILAVASFLPLLSMAASSLTAALGVPLSWDTMTFDNYRFAILENDTTQRAIRNSFQLAGVTAIVGLTIATTVAYLRTRRRGLVPQLMDSAISLPYALPGLVIALAMIFAWLQPIPGVNWNPGLYGTSAIILIAYIVRFTYYQLRAMVTGFLQVDKSMEEAARASGVGRFQTWRKILLPLLVPAIMSGTALVVFVALTELTVSSLLWSSGSETIGVRVFGFQAAGYSRYATALSTVIVIGLLVSMGLIGLFNKLWQRRTRIGDLAPTGEQP
jgi:iron(III) transport system permease protein